MSNVNKQISSVVAEQLFSHSDNAMDVVWDELDQCVDDELLNEVTRLVQHSMEYAITEICRKIEAGDFD